jgi:hypothetical protein
MKKMNNILKMISQMEKNAEEVKLAKHEVKLALIDDLRKQANTSSKLNAENINLLNKVRSNYKESLSILSKVETEAQRAFKLAVELGVGDAIYKDFLNSVKQDISVNQKLLDKYS